ncbi:uncharacterized protein LOC114008834 [Tupaia chinensis]|uniref:uncharacterized protein LOC114008834 n=1 Tax=Tupaia chinensis TaxID=246437 RepID=UPI000FFB1693|nr:uncharacterized protein LOC114008834 [Tupaia chinensis]
MQKLKSKFLLLLRRNKVMDDPTVSALSSGNDCSKNPDLDQMTALNYGEVTNESATTYEFPSVSHYGESSGAYELLSIPHDEAVNEISAQDEFTSEPCNEIKRKITSQYELNTVTSHGLDQESSTPYEFTSVPDNEETTKIFTSYNFLPVSAYGNTSESTAIYKSKDSSMSGLSHPAISEELSRLDDGIEDIDFPNMYGLLAQRPHDLARGRGGGKGPPPAAALARGLGGPR